MNDIHSVMSASEITAQVTVSQRTVTTQCKLWQKQGLARKVGRDWIVNRAAAEEYIKTYKKA